MSIIKEITMDQAEKSNLVLPTPSRTLRLPTVGYDTNKYNYNYILNGNVYFLTFDKIEDAVEAYKTLKDDKVSVRYHVYSLFTKFDEVLAKNVLEKKVKDILKNTNYNITYLRVDNSNKDNDESHTGKVVVDRLEECKLLLSYKDDSNTRLRFYRFDPKKAIKKGSNNVTKNVDNDGFKVVTHKKRYVNAHKIQKTERS